MTKVAVRGLAQRKLRALVTILAILLGVAFIAGSYVLTDTINRSFDDLFDEAYAGTDVAVSSSTTGQADSGDLPPFSERYLDVVRQVPGVEAAEGGIFSLGRFVDEKGDPLSNSFAPEFISSTSPEPFQTLTYTEGRPPHDRRRGLDRRVHRRPRGPRHRRHAADRRAGGGQAVPDRRPPAARQHLVGRLQHRPAHASRGPAPDRQAR